MALETPSRPPLHGKYHLKFPFRLFDNLPKHMYFRHPVFVVGPAVFAGGPVVFVGGGYIRDLCREQQV